MTDDGTPTWDAVARWLRPSIRRDIELALPAPLRGWLTRAEAEDYDGPFVEISSLSDLTQRFLPTLPDWREQWPRP